MKEKQYQYINKNGDTQYLFTTYINYERVRLKNLLIEKGIKFSGNHWLIYCHYLENIHLEKYFKSNETIAADIGVHKNTVKQLKKDFEEIKILSLEKQNGESDICHFERIIKITWTKNSPVQKGAEQNLCPNHTKKSFSPEQILFPNIKAKEFNKEVAHKKATAKIKCFLIKSGVSELQINKFIMNSFDISYILEKCKQYKFLLKFNKDKIKGEGRYLFNSIKNDWLDDKYLKYQKNKNDAFIKTEIEKAGKALEEKKRKSANEIEAACIEYYNSLDDETKKEINNKIDQGIPPIFKENPIKYQFAFDSRKVMVLKELLLENKS